MQILEEQSKGENSWKKVLEGFEDIEHIEKKEGEIFIGNLLATQFHKLPFNSKRMGIYSIRINEKIIIYPIFINLKELKEWVLKQEKMALEK